MLKRLSLSILKCFIIVLGGIQRLVTNLLILPISFNIRSQVAAIILMIRPPTKSHPAQPRTLLKSRGL